MTNALPQSALGDVNDSVRLYVAGQPIVFAESYQVECGVMSPPYRFALTIGTNENTSTLLRQYQPNQLFELYIGNARQMYGYLDDPSTDGGDNGTRVTLRGRDVIAKLTDPCFTSEKSFTNLTYLAFATQLLRMWGIHGGISPNNDNGRKIQTGVPTVAIEDPNTVQQILEDSGTSSGGGVAYRSITAKLGERPYHLLKRHLDRVGLFFYAAPDGSFVLSAPNPHQKPTYHIRRFRGQTRGETNIISHSYHNGSEPPRYSECHVYSRTRGRIHGRAHQKGYFVDDEMTAWGFDRPLVIRDAACVDANQAAYLARRKLAEGRRSVWHLSYTLAGHSYPSLVSEGRAVWAPDTIVHVTDEELGLDDDYWIESVVHRRSPYTTSTIKLMRTTDLFFGADE